MDGARVRPKELHRRRCERPKSTRGDRADRAAPYGHALYLAGRPVSIIIIVMIVGALYFALRPKKWETAAAGFDEMPDEYAEVKDD